MSEYKIVFTAKFKKDYKLLQKQHRDTGELFRVIDILAKGGVLDRKYSDHQLSGDYSGCSECHIAPDWLLIYKKSEDKLLLVLVRSGSHSDLFG